MSIILTAAAGAIIGLLINYFSDVLPETQHFTRPRCRNCRQPLSFKDYLVAYHCSDCGTRRPVRTIIVLFCAITVSILLKYFPFSTLDFWSTLPILLFLGVIVVIDIEHHLVLFETSIFGLVLFMMYGILLHGFLISLKGALAGFVIMFIFYLFGLLFTKIMRKLRHKEINEVAFGFGDVCAGTFLGLLAGWPAIAGAIMMAMLLFGAFSLVFILVLLISKRYDAFTDALPFVPFLIFGVVLLFYL